MKKNVVLLGGFPPPVGGNSVHIERLARELIANGYRCHVVDPYSDQPIKTIDGLRVSRVGGKGVRSLIEAAWLIRKIKPDVVHIHVSAMERFVYAGPILLMLIGSASRRVLTIHSGSFAKRFVQQAWLKRALTVGFLKRFDHLITVNAEQKTVLLRYGCDTCGIDVIPAYLEPEMSESDLLSGVVAKARTDEKCLLVTSGYGLELYGYEKIIAALCADKELSDRYRLAICMYNTYEESYIAKIENAMADLGDALIFRGLSAGEFAYLLDKSAVYVRATDRDGDAVAIREAHSFGVTVVASSVVPRPDYCLTFDRSSCRSLVTALKQCIEQQCDGKAEQSDEDNVAKILNAYAIERQ